MKIILILSDILNFDYNQLCNSHNFLILQKEEKEANIINPIIGDNIKAKYTFYSSNLVSSQETINKLFGKQNIIIEPLLDEIVFDALIDKDLTYDNYKKEVIKLWKKNNDSLQIANNQCEDLLKKLEEKDEDAVVVSHPIRIDILINIMKKNGYLIEKPRLFGIKPLDRIRASKKNLHCGNCKYNCLLTHPRCDIGRDKANIRGIEIKDTDHIASRF